ETRGKAHPDRDARQRRDGRRELIRPDGECDKVRRDLWRLTETRARPTLVETFLGRNGHVRDRGVPGRMDQLEGELRLEFGFIEAREGAPGVGRLELRRGVALFTAERAIKPPERAADAALPGSPPPRRPKAYLLRFFRAPPIHLHDVSTQEDRALDAARDPARDHPCVLSRREDRGPGPERGWEEHPPPHHGRSRPGLCR